MVLAGPNSQYLRPRGRPNVNALVNLDCFAALVPMTVDSLLEQTKDYFGAYLR